MPRTSQEMQSRRARQAVICFLTSKQKLADKMKDGEGKVGKGKILHRDRRRKGGGGARREKKQREKKAKKEEEDMMKMHREKEDDI